MALIERSISRSMVALPECSQTRSKAGWPVWPRPLLDSGGSALTRLEAAIGLVDDVNAPLSAHQPVVAVTRAQRFQRIPDLHGQCLLGGASREMVGARGIEPLTP